MPMPYEEAYGRGGRGDSKAVQSTLPILTRAGSASQGNRTESKEDLERGRGSTEFDVQREEHLESPEDRGVWCISHRKGVPEGWGAENQMRSSGGGQQDKPGPHHEVPCVTSAQGLAQSKPSE